MSIAFSRKTTENFMLFFRVRCVNFIFMLLFTLQQLRYLNEQLLMNIQ
jgi:hypothetical protein